MSEIKQPRDYFFQMNMADMKRLKKIQDKFSAITNLTVSCLDNEGVSMIELSGNQEDIALLHTYVDFEQCKELFHRVTDSNIEDQVVEDTEYDNLKLASLAIRVQNKTFLTWIVAAALKDAEDRTETKDDGARQAKGFQCLTTEKEFYMALDLLREMSYYTISKSTSIMDAQAATRKSRFSEKEMEATLKRMEINTAIISQLDSSQPLESILQEIAGILGEYLNNTGVQIFRTRNGSENIDLIAEWCRPGIVSSFEKTQDIPRYFFIKHETQLVVSFDTLTSQEIEEQLKEFKIKALMSFPIFINGQAGMYICFSESVENRTWQIADVKFVKDSIKIIESIITRRIQKNSLASSYASLESILDNVGCGIYVRRIEDNKPLFVNRYFKEIFSTEMANDKMDSILDDIITVSSESGYCEWNQRQKEKWYDIKYTKISWVDGRRVMLFATFDVTDKKVYQQKIELQASTDFLTGLLNRMSCERDLARYIDETTTNHSTGAILYMDLDDFKHINDGLGHQYGDALLRDISFSLKQVKGIEHTCYRMGGDEFVMIIPPQFFDEEERIIKDIQTIFDTPWFLKDADYYCSMSMGMVRFPDGAATVQELIKNADIAMYAAKREGKKRSTEYEEKFAPGSSNRRLDMEKNMRHATEEGYHEFVVYYQPITDIAAPGTPCCGAEALIRWNSEQLGFISPAEFIPLAEYLGLINPIGNYVLESACYACKKWNDSGYPHYKVNVNLSVVQLLQPDIVEIVEKAIKKTGINPHNLTLEVTESLAIHDMERMKQILGDIKKLGVRIALDDFGTGYSSLNHIREIPFDVIKVDQSFVKDLAEDAYSQSFISMVSELANTIGVSICVEGIETKEQYKVLEGMKVRLIQGYYFGKPMPQDEFEKKYIVKND